MLKIEGLAVAYHDRPILHGISLSVDTGEILTLIGPNGAGKSTLIRAVSGVVPIESGDISVDGQDLREMSTVERARLLAVVPQARNLPPAFTVYESILLGRTPYLGWFGRTSPEDHERVRYALERTQLLPLSEARVGELSGGEQQRVLLARALAQETPVMLLDEPVTHLDLQHREKLIRLIRDLVDQKELAVLMVLHDLNMAAMYAERIALLVAGRIEAVGTPSEVLTEANLTRIYDIPVRVIPHPEYGSPLVLPDGHGKKRD